jgi:hypothetical protein
MDGISLIRYFNFDELPQTKTVTCNCRRSKCLKKYCDCLAQNKLCSKQCRCKHCENHENSANLMKYKCELLEANNPTNNNNEPETKCNCRNSRCLKKYCVCFAAKSECTDQCKCLGCNNRDTFLPMLEEQDAKSAINYLAVFEPAALPECFSEDDERAENDVFLRSVFKKRPIPETLLFPKKKQQQQFCAVTNN